MEKLNVSFLDSASKEVALQEISFILDNFERNLIEVAPWPDFTYKPKASFSIGYNLDCIFLKFFVTENSVRAMHRSSNEPVSEDSCVEFFISFDSDKTYYNLEFNCLGTCLAGYGSSRTGRTLIPEKFIRNIRRLSVIKSHHDSEMPMVNWELTIMIPFDVFIYHQITSLKTHHCRANFFKCGDGLPERHFLAWRKITAESPDFHLPQFFGQMYFI